MDAGGGQGGVPQNIPARTGDGPPPVILAAGDIACEGCAQRKTAALLGELSRDGRAAAILPLGDEAYGSGSLAEFEASYAPAWGVPSLLALSRPVPGNHEYHRSNGDGYFDYFNGPGRATGVAGTRGQGYYSFDAGSWHLVALNTSNGCRKVDCAHGSPQQIWLAADLAAHPSRCTLAYWHIPRFQGGTESDETEAVGPLWETFFDHGGDLVINAHEHNYQQLAPLGRTGEADPGGVRSFVVGTGGAGFEDSFGAAHDFAVETRVVREHGVLEVTLAEDGYSWRFVTVDGVVPPGASGSGRCR
jgi:hypothetical protein